MFRFHLRLGVFGRLARRLVIGSALAGQPAVALGAPHSPVTEPGPETSAESKPRSTSEGDEEDAPHVPVEGVSESTGASQSDGVLESEGGSGGVREVDASGGPASEQAQLEAPKSELERSLIAEALAHFGWQLERDPVGKEIEVVEIYVLDVFDDRDPIPNFVNVFHTNTRDWVVRQEVLVQPGGRFDAGRVLETERNLRRLRQISLANVVAARGSSPDKVRLIVVVKDVWSLRLNSNYKFGSNGLDLLLLNPSEENLAGIRASVGATYQLERDQHQFGGFFSYPRILGSRWSASVGSTFKYNRDTFEPEGTSGSFAYGLPLYSRYSTWGLVTSLDWNVETTREFSRGVLRTFDYDPVRDQIFLRNPDEPRGELVPFVYRTETLSSDYYFVRSYGVTNKYNLFVGLETVHRKFQAPESPGYSPAATRAFEALLPQTDRRVSPYVQLGAFTTRFHRILNVESLGLQEDYALGHAILARVYGGVESVLSTRNHVGVDAGLGYTWAVGDGLFRALVSHAIRYNYEDGLPSGEDEHDALVSASFRLVSPSFFGGGRVHVDGQLHHRYRNYLRRRPFVLGGDNRLRGFPQEAFRGRDLVALNLEYRTGAVDILSAQVGMAGFVDVADVPASVDETDMRVGVGTGLRILFPQAERTVMRVDLGFPLRRFDTFGPQFFLTFGQAFSMPSL